MMTYHHFFLTKSAIKALNNNKCADSNNTIGEFLKMKSSKLLNLIHKRLPIDGKQKQYSNHGRHQVTILYKEVDPNNPKNYRVIFILDQLGKCFNNILRNRITQLTRSTRYDFQFGFSQNRSNADAIYCIYITSTITNSTNHYMDALSI